MKVSVVIPTFNRADKIAGAITSVAHQTEPPDEIIIVDDGSTDDTKKVVDSLKMHNLRYIWQPNLGGNAARNAGIGAATHPWIAFHDSDDFWLPHKLETLRKALELQDASGAEVIFSSFILYDPAKHKASVMPKHIDANGEKSILYEAPLMQTNILTANPISTQTLLASKQVLEAVGNFDPSLPRFQDWDLAIRLAEAGKFIFIPEPLCYVAISSDSVTRNFKAGVSARRRLLEKHRKLYRSRPSEYRKARFDLLIRQIAGSIKVT